MLIWLVTVGEPLPIDAGDPRLMRAGILAEILASRGHDVVWWTSTFNHVLKKHRFQGNTTVRLSQNYCIKLLHGPGYSKDISISRIINHKIIARIFGKLAPQEEIPRVILCSMPTIELAAQAAIYGCTNSVPVIIDIRDLWPDIFLDLVPHWGRGLSRVILNPFFKTLELACKKATAIVGPSSGLINWALQYAGRERSPQDRVFCMGYSETPPSVFDQVRAKKFWSERGIIGKNDTFLTSFFGHLGIHSEIETVIKAAKLLEKDRRKFKFIFCGSGPKLGAYQEVTSDMEHFLFPGLVGAAEIWCLMRMSSVGLAPYKSTTAFLQHIPNKPIEYMSAGLPVVSSLQGTLADFLSANSCGVTYMNGDAEELAMIITDLADNPGKLKAMSSNAATLFEERFAASKVYGGMVDYLEQMAEFGSLTERIEIPPKSLK